MVLLFSINQQVIIGSFDPKKEKLIDPSKNSFFFFFHFDYRFIAAKNRKGILESVYTTQKDGEQRTQIVFTRFLGNLLFTFLSNSAPPRTGTTVRHNISTRARLF